MTSYLSSLADYVYSSFYFNLPAANSTLLLEEGPGKNFDQLSHLSMNGQPVEVIVFKELPKILPERIISFDVDESTGEFKLELTEEESAHLQLSQISAPTRLAMVPMDELERVLDEGKQLVDMLGSAKKTNKNLKSDNQQLSEENEMLKQRLEELQAQEKKQAQAQRNEEFIQRQDHVIRALNESSIEQQEEVQDKIALNEEEMELIMQLRAAKEKSDAEAAHFLQQQRSGFGNMAPAVSRPIAIPEPPPLMNFQNTTLKPALPFLAALQSGSPLKHVEVEERMQKKGNLKERMASLATAGGSESKLVKVTADDLRQKLKAFKARRTQSMPTLIPSNLIDHPAVNRFVVSQVEEKDAEAVNTKSECSEGDDIYDPTLGSKIDQELEQRKKARLNELAKRPVELQDEENATAMNRFINMARVQAENPEKDREEEENFWN